MKLNNLFILCLLLSLEGCSVFKEGLAQKGGQQEAIRNAILDFSNTSRLYKKDSVFSVRAYNPLHKMILKETTLDNSEWIEGKPYENIIAISISATYNKILLADSIDIGDKDVRMPTRHVEKDGKLFYWKDENYPLTQETIDAFAQYGLLVKDDLDGVIEFYDFTINDAQKGVDYYFCKNDLTQYKKVVTNKGIGYYKIPKLNCNN